jgi:hypothetical protein
LLLGLLAGQELFGGNVILSNNKKINQSAALTLLDSDHRGQTYQRYRLDKFIVVG